MLARPLPPEHSAPVDGYRDITAALSAVSLNQQLIFGHIRPQTAEESANPSIPNPEFAVNVAGDSTGSVSLEPRLPPFTVGITREDPVVTAKGSKFANALKTSDFVPAGDSNVNGVVDRTAPELTFQFGSFPPMDAASGSTSESSGQLDQVAPAELESLKSDTGDEWQVRDFGYGFGHMSGTRNAAEVVRDELNVREQQRVQELRQREDQERRQKEDQERRQKEDQELESGEVPQDRPRRGSFNGGYERGAYAGRRGRSLNGGYGRGYGRNFSRGGYSQYSRHQHQYSPTPPAQFSQLAPHTTQGYSPDQSVYFLPPPPPLQGFGPYRPGGYEVYQYPSFPPPPPLYPPVPHPVSHLPFQLDHTRYYLLGQLEYYLSPQNMAQDFYLRQQASTVDDITAYVF
jgi:la-related protein 1